MLEAVHEGDKLEVAGGYWQKDCRCKSVSAVRPDPAISCDMEGGKVNFRHTIGLRCLECGTLWKWVK